MHSSPKKKFVWGVKNYFSDGTTGFWSDGVYVKSPEEATWYNSQIKAENSCLRTMRYSSRLQRRLKESGCEIVYHEIWFAMHHCCKVRDQ